MAEHSAHQVELLRRYEIAGLRLMAWLHLTAALLTIIGALSTAKGALRISNIFMSIIPFAIFALIILRVERITNLERLGLLTTLFDSLLMAWLPISWYLFQGNAMAPEMLVKNDLVIFYILLAGIQSITLRPKQPLVVAAVGVIVITACYVWAASIGLPPAAKDSLTAITTNQVDVNSFWFRTLFMMPFGCGTLAVLAWRGRKLVARSASLERSITSLSRYFSPKIVDELINNEVLNSSLNGQQREIAVLFVDLESFTQLSESLPPNDVVTLLADYYQRMVECIFANNGSVDKFLGDGLMATFNMLGDQPQAARQSVLAGIAMQKALSELNVTRQLHGLVPLKQRIGIHFGSAIIGNVGTSQRMEFTAIGDTVNTASRLQEICKQLHTDFLISDSIYRQFPQVSAKDMGKVVVRGKSDIMQVYAVISN